MEMVSAVSLMHKDVRGAVDDALTVNSRLDAGLVKASIDNNCARNANKAAFRNFMITIQ